MVRRGDPFAVIVAGLLLAGCAELAPLRQPPPTITEGLEVGAAKADLISRYGPPAAIREGPEGEILIYRRVLATHKSPNRFYSQLREARYERAELLYLYFDQNDRLLRWEARDDRG